MIRTMMVAARDRARLEEVVSVAGRFGADVLLARLGLHPTPDAGTLPLDMPVRTRQTIEALGPTFMKLGQILATRADLLPPAWIAELEKLQSDAPTLSFETLRPEVEAALGEPPEQAFAAFDPVPLAAASMAQIHRATLKDGQAVVLKIRRPGIRRKIEADLRLIAELAKIAERASAEIRRLRPGEMLAQLNAAMLEELDFRIEGRNADRFQNDFDGDASIVVPRIHWAFSSETLLVMDYVEGVPPTDGARLEAAGIDPAAIAIRGADLVLDMVLINGRFHGDPHPGNLLCLQGNRIALLDLGLVGHVSPRRREEFVDFMQSLMHDDARRLEAVLFVWASDNEIDRGRLLIAAERLVAKHGSGQLLLSAMVGDFMGLMREEQLTLPPDLLLIFKAMVTIDGVLAGIQPGFDLTAAMRRASSRILGARLSSAHWQPLVERLAWEALRIGDDAPRLIRALVTKIEAPAAVPAPPARPFETRWIAGSIFAGGLMIAAAILLR